MFWRENCLKFTASSIKYFKEFFESKIYFIATSYFSFSKMIYTPIKLKAVRLKFFILKSDKSLLRSISNVWNLLSDINIKFYHI